MAMLQFSVRKLSFGVSILMIAGLASRTNAAIPPGPFGEKSTLLAPVAPKTPSKSSTAAAPTSAPNPAASTESTATAKLTCSDLRRAALNMSVHASNLANRSTTRTPEGGPYQRQEVVCKVGGAFCNIEKVAGEERLELQPGHPDANSQGYVRYPAINVESETAGLNNAAAEVKLLASRGVCGATILEQGTMSIVKYNPDFDVMMDTMTFGFNGNLSRWSRTTRDGKTQNLAFKADGSASSL